jgi:hypothetical protein
MLDAVGRSVDVECCGDEVDKGKHVGSIYSTTRVSLTTASSQLPYVAIGWCSCRLAVSRAVFESPSQFAQPLTRKVTRMRTTGTCQTDIRTSRNRVVSFGCKKFQEP